MNNTEYKVIFIALVIVAVFTNIYMHELGHYIAAEKLNLNPRIMLANPIAPNSQTSFFNPEIAQVIYNGSSNLDQDKFIAFMGPFMNIQLALFIGLFYFMIPEKEMKRIFLVMIVISIISAITNIIPIPGTDGSILFN